jgi:hypothetical protein
MPTDAHGTDPGGNEIGVLVFVDDGYLDNVEVFGYGDGSYAGLPAASALKLSNGVSGSWTTTARACGHC